MSVSEPISEPELIPNGETQEITTAVPEPDITTIVGPETSQTADPESDVISEITTETSPEVSTQTEETDRGINQQYLTMILVGALAGAGLVGVGVFVGVVIARKKN